jgi:hypothetical protein
MSALSLIRTGDPVAIAAVLNRSLNSQGVQVKARRRGEWLYLLLEAASPLAQRKVVAFVRAGLRLLNVESIQRVTVYGRQQGDRIPAWQKTIDFSPLAIDPAAIDPASPPEPEIPDLLKRPEAVAFVIFFSLVLFWDAYMTAIEQVQPAQLTSGQLAHRLKTTRSAVRAMQHRDYFSEWTRSRDPENTAWLYQRGWYVPK